MSGQIFQPNLTEPGRAGHIQRGWQFSASSCNRPAADYDQPIICVAYGPSDVTNLNYTSEKEWLLFRSFSACCPTGVAVNNTRNVYTVTRHCGTQACFTSDEEVARGWDECVKRETVVAFEKLKSDGVVLGNATKAEDAFGRCEYIDYAALKKGVLQGGGGQKSVVLSVRMVLTIGFGVLLVGGGLF